jgi:hypothetical protein
MVKIDENSPEFLKANINLCKCCCPLIPVYAHSGMKQPDCAKATIFGCCYTMFYWKPEGKRVITPPSFICKLCCPPLALVGATKWPTFNGEMVIDGQITSAFLYGCFYTLFVWKPAGVASKTAPAPAPASAPHTRTNTSTRISTRREQAVQEGEPPERQRPQPEPEQQVAKPASEPQLTRRQKVMAKAKAKAEAVAAATKTKVASVMAPAVAIER